MGLLARDSESERWLAVLLRSAHLAGVVWLGAKLLGSGPAGAAGGGHGPELLVLASGLVMLVMDLRARRIALNEVAGASVLAKLALVVWMALAPALAGWIFWLLVLGSSLTSHAPKGFRHWPSPAPQQRASKAARPG